MYLSHLRLANFRSYEALDLELRPGTTIFCGANGHGKTNLLEAVHVLATLTSHRVSSHGPLIREGCDCATLSARVQASATDDRALSVGLEIRQGMANKALLNRAPVRPREIIGAVRMVCFAPEDLGLVRGDPAGRRDFIDTLLITRWPRLAGVKAEFERALKQKTALLKTLARRGATPSDGEMIAAWNEVMITRGSELVAARLRSVRDLAPRVSHHYDQIAPMDSRAHLSYHSSSLDVDASEDEIHAQLAEHSLRRRDEEIARGVCLVGPHRDDLVLSLSGRPVKGYASHGEGWSYALAMRLASLDVLHQDGLDPILLLDDVFAELDEDRRRRVADAMESVEQRLVSVAVTSDVPGNLHAEVFHVHPGRVEEVPR